MARNARIALMAMCLVCAPTAPGQEPPAKPKLKVEFYWAELKPIKGVTQDEPVVVRPQAVVARKGGLEIDETKPQMKVYLHKRPVLTGDCVAKTELIKDESQNRDYPPHFKVWLRLTEKAKDTLADESKDRKRLHGILIVVVDGNYWYVMGYHKQIATARKFIPVIGDFKSEADAQRFIDVIK